MAEKLDTGDQFPSMTLNLVGGGQVNLPGDLPSDYNVVLFFRGHWWPYCRRQLDGFSKSKDALGAAGVGFIMAASVDTGDTAKEVADGLDFPVAEGVTHEQAEALGSWWEDRRGIIQPSEFLLDKQGKVLTSSYSSGPLARMEAEDVIKLVGLFERRKQEAAKG